MNFSATLSQLEKLHIEIIKAKDKEIEDLKKKLNTYESTHKVFELSEIVAALESSIPLSALKWDGWVGCTVLAVRIKDTLDVYNGDDLEEYICQTTDRITQDSLPESIDTWSGWPGTFTIARQVRYQLVRGMLL